MKNLKLGLLLICSGCWMEPMRSGDETCLDFVEVVSREPSRVQYTVPVVDFDTQLTAPMPVAGLQMKVCVNATCEPELPRCAGDVGACWREFPAPNPALRVLDFPYGISNVVIRVSADGYVPTDYFLGGPMIGSPDGNLEVRGVGIVLVKTSTYAALHGQVGITPDPNKGTLAIRVLDCGLDRAFGQTIAPWNSNLEGSVGFSLSSNNLVTDSRLTTDARGVAGFFNLLPQTIDVLVEESNFGPTTFNIRPGVLTLGELRWGLEEFGQ